MSLILTADKPNYTDRILALNLQVCKRFQCGGFWLNANKISAVVEPGPNIQHDKLQQGLLDGRLVDITDQTIKGLEIEGTRHTPPQEGNIVGNKVYFQIDTTGNVLVVIPKDNEEEAKFEGELKDKGSITAEHYKIADHNITTPGGMTPGDAGDLINQIGTRLETAKEKVYVPRLK